MDPLLAWAVPLCGAGIGCVIGYAARRGRLCTFGAIEDAFVAGEFRRLKILALALAIALIVTQIAILTGELAPDTIRYLPLQFPWLAIAIGGLTFGFGMALVGTCAFGSLVRFGGGDLRSFVTILVYALTALAVLRGGLASVRIAYIESVSVAMPGGVQADLAALMGWLAGLDLRAAILAMSGAALLIWAARGGEVWQMPRLLLSGVALGIGAGAAWLVTGVLTDQVSLVVEPEGLTFVAPVADAIQALSFPSAALWNFGVASVLGVIAGAFLASVLHDEFRWEAFDDQREMKRHIAGGVLMGVGGVLAGGCTIGQGITAGSVLALSWPLAVAGMMLGARAGLYYLLRV
jgi:hypothetical protein